MHKRRTETRAAAVALVIEAVVSCVAAFTIKVARHETREARDQTTGRLADAGKAVDVAVTGIAEDLKWLPDSP